MVIKSIYKEKNTLQKRLKMLEQAKQDQIILVIEKDPKCKAYPDLKNNTFTIHKHQKVIQIINAIRKRIVNIDKKYQNQALFIFTEMRIPHKDMTIEELYEKEKDQEDGFLYIKYSNMEPFGAKP